MAKRRVYLADGRVPETAEDFRLVRRALMEQRGVTNKQLTERWAVSASFVARLINGESRAAEKEEDLAQLLGVEWRDIFASVERGRTRDFVPLSEGRDD